MEVVEELDERERGDAVFAGEAPHAKRDFSPVSALRVSHLPLWLVGEEVAVVVAVGGASAVVRGTVLAFAELVMEYARQFT